MQQDHVWYPVPVIQTEFVNIYKTIMVMVPYTDPAGVSFVYYGIV